MTVAGSGERKKERKVKCLSLTLANAQFSLLEKRAGSPQRRSFQGGRGPFLHVCMYDFVGIYKYPLKHSYPLVAHLRRPQQDCRSLTSDTLIQEFAKPKDERVLLDDFAKLTATWASHSSLLIILQPLFVSDLFLNCHGLIKTTGCRSLQAGRDTRP